MSCHVTWISCSFSAEAEDAPKRPKDRTSMLPGTLTRPCVVRSKVEDPDVLRRRQELQQSKSIHELSKIGNVNQIPLPFKLPLPDIPLPTVSNLFKKGGNSNGEAGAGAGGTLRSAEGYSPPVSPDRTEQELLQ